MKYRQSKIRMGLVLLAISVACGSVVMMPGEAAAQDDATPKAHYACYVPTSGAVYLIKEPGMPEACRSPNHVLVGLTELQVDATSGGVGIGTSNPTATLDVVGDVHISEELRVGNSVTIDPVANTISTGAGETLELHVGGGRALRLEPKSGDHPNLIGGSAHNQVDRGVIGGTISGGGTWDYENTVSGNWGTVGGGSGNSAGQGSFNTVVGGNLNTASGGYSSVGGGESNRAEGEFSTVPGGSENRALGKASFAAGTSAGAEHDGSFVWADYSDPGLDFGSTDANQFLVRASGGVALTGSYGTGTIPMEGVGERLMWYPGKAAFRAGRLCGAGYDNSADIGDYSFGFGYCAEAREEGSISLGIVTKANYPGSVAIGHTTEADAISATAIGFETRALGLYSTALGASTEASHAYSTAIGRETSASGEASTAMGWATTAGAQASTAMGRGTVASGTNSTAMGLNTTASEGGSTAMGVDTEASGWRSTAMGSGAKATNDQSTAMGNITTASGVASTAMGQNTTASGNYSTAMGLSTEASGDYSTAMGRRASTNGHLGSFVYGDGTVAYVNATADHQFMVQASGGTIFYSNFDLSHGVELAPGGGGWAEVSDASLKENFRGEDGEEVLSKIRDMQVRSWNYKAQGPSIRHVGPTAQDFHAAFGFGTSDRTITTTDIHGINMLAAQALERRTRELQQQLELKDQEIGGLRAELARLLDRIERLEVKQ